MTGPLSVSLNKYRRRIKNPITYKFRRFDKAQNTLSGRTVNLLLERELHNMYLQKHNFIPSETFRYFTIILTA